MSVRWHPSPNCGARRADGRPELIVLHYTAMLTCAAALARLCDPDAEVSAHYLIGNDGTVIQMVCEADRAWHAGAGSWRGRDDVNSRSIGIELDNDGCSPFSEPQMASLEHLLSGIMDRWAILPEDVIGHSDMAPGRKVDPGGRFDWRRLALRGLSIWPDAPDIGDDHGADQHTLEDCLHRIGYPREAGAAACLMAFRLRFRPWARGAADDGDLAVARAVARLCVDPTPPKA